MSNTMGSKTNQNPDANAEWEASVPTSIKKPLMLGLSVMLLFVFGFGGWSFMAPLSGAAIASGVVIVNGQNQDIEHLEGGIIAEISVKEGEVVQAGQTLVVLDETQAEAGRNRVDKQLLTLKASLEKSKAELSNLPMIVFPQEMINHIEVTQSHDMLERLQAEFTSRLRQHQSELNVLDEQVEAIDEEISGLKTQVSAEKRKMGILNSEIKTKKKLLKKGLTNKNQYNTLLKERASVEGSIGGLTASIGQRKKAITEIRVRQETSKATRLAEASKQINTLQTQIDDLQEQLTSRADVLERMIIRAPVEGVIVNITKNTIGSVVRPGESVMEIQPTTDDLIISARVTPQDVDIVKIGQEASIRFSALNTRTTPEVPATIEYLSADRLIDESTQEPYFDARLKLAANLPDGIEVEQIYPGMPVDAFIKTGDRTFIQYLAKPITDSFSKAFREE